MNFQDRVRVYYDDDKTVKAVEYFTDGKNESDEDKIKLPHTKGFESDLTVVMDAAQFGKHHEYTEQLYLEDGEAKVDVKKERGLMPAHIIKHKHVKKLISMLDEALNEDVKDFAKIALYQAEIERCKSQKGDTFWYKQALRNLDAKGLDKPKIRKKLEAKIASVGV